MVSNDVGSSMRTSPNAVSFFIDVALSFVFELMLSQASEKLCVLTGYCLK